MRRWTVSVAVGLGLSMLQVVNGFASLEWCGEDPPVTIVTPSGTAVVVHVTDFARGIEHAPQLALASFEYRVEPAVVRGVAGTRVTLLDTIPTGDGDNFQTRSEVAYHGAQLARAAGLSDEPMRLHFFLPVK